MNDGSRASGGSELRTLTSSTVKSGHVGSERNQQTQQEILLGLRLKRNSAMSDFRISVFRTELHPSPTLKTANYRSDN